MVPPTPRLRQINVEVEKRDIKIVKGA